MCDVFSCFQIVWCDQNVTLVSNSKRASRRAAAQDSHPVRPVLTACSVCVCMCMCNLFIIIMNNRWWVDFWPIPILKLYCVYLCMYLYICHNVNLTSLFATKEVQENRDMCHHATPKGIHYLPDKPHTPLTNTSLSVWLCLLSVLSHLLHCSMSVFPSITHCIYHPCLMGKRGFCGSKVPSRGLKLILAQNQQFWGAREGNKAILFGWGHYLFSMCLESHDWSPNLLRTCQYLLAASEHTGKKSLFTGYETSSGHKGWL